MSSLSDRKTLAGAIILAAVHVLVALIVPPTDGVPHLDDWDYVETSRHFLKTGHLVLSDWPTATLVSHVLWGALFATFLGPSYTSFRVSMLVMSWIGSVGLFVWCRRHDWSLSSSVWLAAIIALCPLNLVYEYSFMTDVTGATAGIWLALLLSSRDEFSHRGAVGIGCLAGFAYLSRQTAVIPLVAYVAMETIRSIRMRSFAPEMVTLLGVFSLFVGSYWVWIDFLNSPPYAAAWHEGKGIPNAAELASRLMIAALATALYLSPITISLWIRSRFRHARRRTAVLVIGLLAGCWLCGTLPAPYERQEVFDLGLGFNDCAAGREVLAGPTVTLGHSTWSLFQIVTTALSLASLFAFVQSIEDIGGAFARLRETWRDHFTDLVVPVSVVGTILLLCTLKIVFGRYYWPVIIQTAMWIVSARPAVFRASPPLSGVLLLAAIAIASLIGLQDNSVIERTIWQAADDLESHGVKPSQINATIEYAGVRRFTPQYRGPKNRGPFLNGLSDKDRAIEIELHSPMTIFADNRPYSISYAPVPNYSVIKTFPYRSWLRTGEILVSEKNHPADTETNN